MSVLTMLKTPRNVRITPAAHHVMKGAALHVGTSERLFIARLLRMLKVQREACFAQDPTSLNGDYCCTSIILDDPLLDGLRLYVAEFICSPAIHTVHIQVLGEPAPGFIAFTNSCEN